GPAVVLSPARDGKGGPVVPVSLADGFQQSGALGADGGAEGGVFHIAAGEHRPVLTQQRRPHGKFGVGRIGKLVHGKGSLHQLLVGHGASLLEMVCPHYRPRISTAQGKAFPLRGWGHMPMASVRVSTASLTCL